MYSDLIPDAYNGSSHRDGYQNRESIVVLATKSELVAINTVNK